MEKFLFRKIVWFILIHLRCRTSLEPLLNPPNRVRHCLEHVASSGTIVISFVKRIEQKEMRDAWRAYTSCRITWIAIRSVIRNPKCMAVGQARDRISDNILYYHDFIEKLCAHKNCVAFLFTARVLRTTEGSTVSSHWVCLCL